MRKFYVLSLANSDVGGTPEVSLALYEYGVAVCSRVPVATVPRPVRRGQRARAGTATCCASRSLLQPCPEGLPASGQSP